GRLLRIRYQRGASPSKTNSSLAAAAAHSDSTDASSAETSARLRRCPMRQPGAPTDRSKASAQPEHSSVSSSYRGNGVPLVESRPTIREAATGGDAQRGGSQEVRQLVFLRPSKGANVPARLSGYENYVQDCIRRHRESHRGPQRQDSGLTKPVESDLSTRQKTEHCSASNGFSKSASTVDFTRSNDNFLQHDAVLTESSNGSSSVQVLRNCADSSASKSESTSALDSVLFTSDEFEDPETRGTQRAVKEWNLIRKPLEVPRPPRFQPGASIEDMRRAVVATSGKKKSFQNYRQPPPTSSSGIDGEYLANLTLLRRLAGAPLNSSSSSSSLFAQSLSLSAELTANQRWSTSDGTSGRRA
uniref:Pro-interleukin-16 n=1 Tax=Macrostomum lignano TaxID=282301 RepID=A0A1I8J3P5_9PLAT